MSSIVEVDYLLQARSRYTQQFKNKPIFDAHIKIFINEILELQDMLQDLIGLRSLETATGSQLDIIGAIVGQPRVLVDFSLFPFFGFEGASQAQTFGSLYDAALGGTWKSISDSEGASFEVDDDTYRFIIKARIVANISNTTPQGVIDAVNYIVSRTDSSIVEMGNAHLKITHYATLTALQEYFLRGLSSIGSIIPLPICVSYEIEHSGATLSTVVDYQFNGTDGATSTTDSTGNTTASGLGVVSGSSFAYIQSNSLFAQDNYTTIDDSGALSPYLIFEGDFEIEVALRFSGNWNFISDIILWQLEDALGVVMELFVNTVEGRIGLVGNPLSLVGGSVLISGSGGGAVPDLSTQQVFKVTRVGSYINIYVDNVWKVSAASTGTVNAGRFKFETGDFERYVDYLRIKKV